MLCLTRRAQESIRINDDIVITVLSLNNGSVRLGIQAPDHVQVNRSEVYAKKQAEKVSA